MKNDVEKLKKIENRHFFKNKCFFEKKGRERFVTDRLEFSNLKYHHQKPITSP